MADWRGAGERIEGLLDASSVDGVRSRERAEDLVGEVADLYGEGLRRIVETLTASDLLDEIARDELVASLLLVHGLHPHDPQTRVGTALDGVRPYLGSHGGDVELLGVDVDTGVVRLRLKGTCSSCPSSSVTLELAVREAIEAAAPEITDIVVVGDEPSDHSGLISPDSLMSRVHASAPAGEWVAAPELAELASGEVAGFVVGDVPILVCRIDSDTLAFRDRCARCTESLAGAVLQRRAASSAGTAVLRCPVCHAHYDVRAAGVGIERPDEHLEPLPVLPRDGILSVAVPIAQALR